VVRCFNQTLTAPEGEWRMAPRRFKRAIRARLDENANQRRGCSQETEGGSGCGGDEGSVTILVE